MANKILTVSELAEHLNVHRITIYRLLKGGSLPGFKIGRVWRFDLDEISNWMASGKSTEAMRVATDGHPDGRSDGKADGRLDGRLDGKLDGRADGKLDGRLDGKLDGKLSSDGKARKPPMVPERGRGPAPKSKR
jgi:excisionase family DNA binding protein